MEPGTSLALLIAIPFVGAALGLLVWSNPQALKIWALLVTAASLLALVGMSGSLAEPAAGVPLLYLLPLAAFVSLLGQPPHQENRLAWLTTLMLLGLGLGALVSRDGLGQIFLMILLGLVGLLVYRYRTLSGPDAWWGIGTYGLGIGCIAVALIATAPVSSIAFLLACSILLPLVPVHGGYVAALTGLPGNLPAFLALLLPSLGFHGLLTLIPSVPVVVLQTLVVPALLGALYGSLRALAQSRVVSLVAYAGLAFLSILWWYLAAARTPTPQAAVYLNAVGFSTSGLLLAWYVLRARYGDVDLRALSGLAYPMPRFAVLLSLLALAAMGLPPFGLFSGFMGMLLNAPFPLSGALLIIAVAWLSASWYFLDLVQRLLFGRHRPELRHEDLRQTEMTSLVMLVLILLALGLAPPRFFEPSPPPLQHGAAMESPAWNV